MKRVSLENLEVFVKTLEDQTLYTRAQKRPFTLTVTPKGFEYTPASSGMPRTNQRKYIQDVLNRFNEINSFSPSDYMDITRNASYLLPLVEMYFQQR